MMAESEFLLAAVRLKKSYARSAGVFAGGHHTPRFLAVDDVSFDVARGEEAME